MATTIENYLTDGIVSFAFPKIDTYTNERGEVKKKTYWYAKLANHQQRELLKIFSW